MSFPSKLVVFTGKEKEALDTCCQISSANSPPLILGYCISVPASHAVHPPSSSSPSLHPVVWCAGKGTVSSVCRTKYCVLLRSAEQRWNERLWRSTLWSPAFSFIIQLPVLSVTFLSITAVCVIIMSLSNLLIQITDKTLGEKKPHRVKRNTRVCRNSTIWKDISVGFPYFLCLINYFIINH